MDLSFVATLLFLDLKRDYLLIFEKKKKNFFLEILESFMLSMALVV